MIDRKAIFITGGGSGIGRAIAQHFGQKGWFVGIGDLNDAGMQQTALSLPKPRCFACVLDVRHRPNWNEALSSFAEMTGGKIDVVVNNAGIGTGGNLTDLTDDVIDRMVAVNLLGSVNGARAAFAYLQASAPGSCLLNVCSASALYGTAGSAMYSATKFAVRGLTEALDLEWEAHGIKCCTIMPGFVDTPLLAQPADALGKQSKRDRVVAAGLEFTRVEDVALAAWDAVHGNRLHTPVGRSARQLDFAARWASGLLRNHMRKLLRARLGD